jgi:hypothetical protein
MVHLLPAKALSLRDSGQAQGFAASNLTLFNQYGFKSSGGGSRTAEQRTCTPQLKGPRDNKTLGSDRIM